jgi:hypothetical protein
VQTRQYFEADLRSKRLPNGTSTYDRLGWVVERSEKTVSGRVDVTPPVCGQLPCYNRIMSQPEFLQLAISHGSELLCRPYDIREQQRGSQGSPGLDRDRAIERVDQR